MVEAGSSGGHEEYMNISEREFGEQKTKQIIIQETSKIFAEIKETGVQVDGRNADIYSLKFQKLGTSARMGEKEFAELKPLLNKMDIEEKKRIVREAIADAYTSIFRNKQRVKSLDNIEGGKFNDKGQRLDLNVPSILYRAIKSFERGFSNLN